MLHNRLLSNSILMYLNKSDILTVKMCAIPGCRPGLQLDSPEFEFRQPSDEWAELLILLGGEGWALIWG